jgi:hypothetical protein
MKQRPNFIFRTLENFRKTELEDISSYFGMNLPRKVLKAEYVKKLGAYIVEEPRGWLVNMLEMDLRLLSRLVELGPEKSLYIDYPDFPTVLEVVGIIASDCSDENFKRVWLPKEFYDIVAPCVDDVIDMCESTGRFEIDRAALGYLNLYGVIDLDTFFDKMIDYKEWAGWKSADAFSELITESPVMKLCRVDRLDGIFMASPSLFHPEAVLAGRKDHPDIKDFHKFTPEQAMEAGGGSPFFVFGLGSPEGKKLVEMLGNLGYGEAEIKLECHDIWLNAQMTGSEDTTEAIFSCVSRKQDIIDTFEDYNDCMKVVAAYANSLPKWLLSGYSANETNCLKVVLRTEDDPLESLVKKNPLLGLFVHPAPMDGPCPCGSNLSYRNCHGRHLS